MISVRDLYQEAELNNIPVDHFPMRKREALSIMDLDGQCCIALNPAALRGESDERSKLAHELGHCMTGSFYNQYAAVDCRQRHENRADKWAIRRTVTETELDEAVAAGYTELWQLADYFGISEEMMRKAVCLYTYGNLATELYF